jgi:hypothetical protein
MDRVMLLVAGAPERRVALAFILRPVISYPVGATICQINDREAPALENP